MKYTAWSNDYNENRESYLEIFDQVMSSESLENAERLEDTIRDLIGRKHAIVMASATDALQFSVQACTNPGDEVLVSDFSWISTSSCISMAGCTPVFCDIDLDTYHMSLESVKRMVSPKTKALVYTHLFGNMSDTTEIVQWCNDNNIAFIEDAAQSLGSSLNGVKAGSIGDCSSFSFNTNKVVGGINGGGVLLTDNDNIAKLASKLCRHGNNEMLGRNSRMYTLNAEIIRFRLKNANRDMLKRQEIAEEYSEELQYCPVHIQRMNDSLIHNYHKYTVRFNDKETRDLVRDSLGATIHYPLPLSENKMYENIEHRKDTCNNAKLVTETILTLPCTPYTSDSDIIRCISTIEMMTL